MCYVWGISSSGRAPVLHAKGTEIDTLFLHFVYSQKKADVLCAHQETTQNIYRGFHRRYWKLNKLNVIYTNFEKKSIGWEDIFGVIFVVSLSYNFK